METLAPFSAHVPLGRSAPCGETGAESRAEAFFDRIMDGPLCAPYAPDPDPLPASIGPWCVRAEVGRGGMGIVYRAHAPGAPDRPVALKLSRPGLCSGPPAGLAREADVLARLDSPHVVRLLGSGTHVDGRPYLVLGWVDGQPVGAAARTRTVWERLALFARVSRAVAGVHRRGIVHGDLKPDNVLVRPDGTVVLIDFGAARRLGVRQPVGTGRTLLTPEFAAPEQVLGEAVGPAADVYALGLLLHEMLCGRRRRLPWGLSGGAGTAIGTTPTRYVDGERGVWTSAPPSPDGAGDGLGAALPPEPRAGLDWGIEAVLRRCLRPAPPERYPTAGALTRAVERVLGGLGAAA